MSRYGTREGELEERPSNCEGLSFKACHEEAFRRGPLHKRRHPHPPCEDGSGALPTADAAASTSASLTLRMASTSKRSSAGKSVQRFRSRRRRFSALRSSCATRFRSAFKACTSLYGPNVLTQGRRDGLQELLHLLRLSVPGSARGRIRVSRGPLGTGRGGGADSGAGHGAAAGPMGAGAGGGAAEPLAAPGAARGSAGTSA